MSLECDQPSTSTVLPGAAFRPTHWGTVVKASKPDSPQARQALAKLCEAYWFPLYAFVRRKGYDATEAQDLTQEFFVQMLAKNYLRQADRKRGRFRTFLLSALTHFLANDWNRQHRLKRGGTGVLTSWDARIAEDRYAHEPYHDLTPERLFDRRWATTLLDRAHRRLRKEYEAAGKLALFGAMEGFLSVDGQPAPYKDLGARMQLSEGALKVAVHRMRRRFGELLRQEIAETVPGPDQVESEMRELLAVLRG